MRIPFYKPSIGEDEIAEVVDTLKSGWTDSGLTGRSSLRS
jgi:dTDP-4-amino-4,6-dideoxygalactose transaminase